MSVNGADHDLIKTRLIIDGIIQIITQFHIGVGEENIEFTSVNGILMTKINPNDPNIYPYIPSSSIKGVLRSQAEVISKKLSEDSTIVDKIFGGPNLASHIIVSDALPTEDTKKSFQIVLKPGIAIDRKKQITNKNSLFFIESLQPLTEFKFNMIINNINKENKPLEFKIIKTLFKMIRLGLLFIGGKKSVGMGKFILKNANVKELKSKNDFLFPNQVAT
ncbi:MAG: RAMP superfamily CRISPR-associated protein, partial [Candidatus Helarchaeota archaeon]